MAKSSITPALIFMMKYFFDIEKEITQQLLLTAHLRLIDCKDALLHIGHLVAQK